MSIVNFMVIAKTETTYDFNRTRGKIDEKCGTGGMVEASEDDGVVEEGGVEEGAVGGVERVRAGKLMAAFPACCSARVSG